MDYHGCVSDNIGAPDGVNLPRMINPFIENGIPIKAII
jgi:hypothetical protein